MQCDLIREALSAQLDDEVSPVASDEVAEHLGSCTTCARFASDIAALNRVVRVRPAEPVPDLTASILGAAPAPANTVRASRPEGRDRHSVPSRRVLAAAGAESTEAGHRRHRRRRALLAVGVAAAMVLVAGIIGSNARHGPPADVQIAAGYVTVEPGGEAAQLYLDVSNDGGADAITGATTPAAEVAALHATTVEAGYVSMGDSGRIKVPANGSVTFRPGGAHVMLEGLHEQVAVGDEIPVTVELANSTPVTVSARVVDRSDLADLVGVDPASG